MTAIRSGRIAVVFAIGVSIARAAVIGSQEGLVSARQNQIVFPPANGPCPQNAGLTPPQCSEQPCVDIPDAGICNIQTQEGFPICGCCEDVVVNCAYCGGDAGGGVCNGIGRNNIGYQGCKCSTGDDGQIPPGNEEKVCPEDFDRKTQSCEAETCGGATFTDGICSKRTFLSSVDGIGPYRFCSCCPKDAEIGCNACGGDSGGGRCKGIPQYRGVQYQGCDCNPRGGGEIPIPPIIPFPIPPPGFPIPPPGTPNPKTPCQDTPPKCSECEGKDNWCQSGDHVGCPCTKDCPAEGEEPKCPDEDCRGENEEQQCSTGPNQGCQCKADQCPRGVDVPRCEDASCGGASNSSTISSCKGGQNGGGNKDCACLQYIENGPPNFEFTVQEVLEQQKFITDLINLKDDPNERGGTYMNVDKGCIYLQGVQKPLCAGDNQHDLPQHFIQDNGADDNGIMVLACLPSDTTSPLVAPECMLKATWPWNYGDVFWGEDNCLYEAERTKIKNQCAEPIPPNDAKVVVDNPYYVGPPRQPEQSVPPPQPSQPPSPPPQTPGKPNNPYPFCQGVDLSTLKCDLEHCCEGLIQCPDWCIDNCGGTCRG